MFVRQPDVTGAVETASVVNGDVGPVLVWHAPLAPGSYDIVIDLEPKRRLRCLNRWAGQRIARLCRDRHAISASPGTHPDRDHRSDRLAVCCWREPDQKKIQLMRRKYFLSTQ